TWVTLRFEGVDANRSALHARVRISVETPRGPRDVHAVVGSGGSFGGSSLQQEIGLGDATAIREIEVRWPGSGRVETFREVERERIYYLLEGSGELRPVEQPVVPLAVRRP
ncbi:MAG: ASPIC/UnbV domain-containing protein, partial [Gemmatimonadota bacterium]|nr:ASPIC/UnbV domain-containing protein [Gemmatimonadota bacterium]